MKRIDTASFISGAILSAYWAYTIISTLIREIATNITVIDLGVIFLVGLISGTMLTLGIYGGLKSGSQSISIAGTGNVK